MCTLVRYNKGTARAVIPFYVARYLPHCIGQILYEYLVYVRPFVRYLRAQHDLPRPPQAHYLWPSCSKVGAKAT